MLHYPECSSNESHSVECYGVKCGNPGCLYGKSLYAECHHLPINDYFNYTVCYSILRVYMLTNLMLSVLMLHVAHESSSQ